MGGLWYRLLRYVGDRLSAAPTDSLAICTIITIAFDGKINFRQTLCCMKMNSVILGMMYNTTSY